MEPISAVAEPKPKLKKKETHTSELPVGQPSTIVMPEMGQPLEHDNRIAAVESPLETDYLEALKFNEDALTIIVSPALEKNAPQWVEAWVNGKGIEVMLNGRWLEFKSIPTGKRIVTKRKYVEVLLRQKRQDIRTAALDVMSKERDDRAMNELQRTESLVTQLTVLHDPSPKGGEWLQRCLGLLGA